MREMEHGMVEAPIGYTNKVLFEADPKEDVYFVPAYLRVKVKNFT